MRSDRSAASHIVALVIALIPLGACTSSQLGASAMLGRNGTGSHGFTQIYGTDLVVKWRPLSSDRGWPLR